MNVFCRMNIRDHANEPYLGVPRVHAAQNRHRHALEQLTDEHPVLRAARNRANLGAGDRMLINAITEGIRQNDARRHPGSTADRERRSTGSRIARLTRIFHGTRIRGSFTGREFLDRSRDADLSDRSRDADLSDRLRDADLSDLPTDADLTDRPVESGATARRVDL